MKKIFSLFLLILVALPSAALADSFEDIFKITEDEIIYEEPVQVEETTISCSGPNGPNDIGGCVYPEPYPGPGLDVVFVIDSTGSMNDEIREVKTQLSNIIKMVESGYPRPDLRIGLVTYRDHKEQEHQYLIKKYDLTRDTNYILSQLNQLQARGGGDYPEAVEDGLDAAINGMSWRPEVYTTQGGPNDIFAPVKTSKIIILIGDAAPHGYGANDNSYEQGCPEGHYYKDLIQDAQDKNIRIFTVSGSGMESIGVDIWQEIASKTGGSYHKLSYVRKDVDQYYTEKSVSAEFFAEAKADRDYDKSSNTILTNSLADFAGKTMAQAAEDAGVKYDDELYNQITGDVVYEKPKGNFSSFLQTIFDKLIFWN